MQINVVNGLYKAGWSHFVWLAILDFVKVTVTARSLQSSAYNSAAMTQRLIFFSDVLTSGLLLTADSLWAAAILTALQADFPGSISHDFRFYNDFGSGMRIFMPRKQLEGNPEAPVWSRPDDHRDLKKLAGLNAAVRLYESLRISSLVVRVCTNISFDDEGGFICRSSRIHDSDHDSFHVRQFAC